MGKKCSFWPATPAMPRPKSRRRSNRIPSGCRHRPLSIRTTGRQTESSPRRTAAGRTVAQSISGQCQSTRHSRHCSTTGHPDALPAKLLQLMLLRLHALLEAAEAEVRRLVVADELDVGFFGDLVFQAGGPVAGVDEQAAGAFGRAGRWPRRSSSRRRGRSCRQCPCRSSSRRSASSGRSCRRRSACRRTSCRPSTCPSTSGWLSPGSGRRTP